ncbi:thioredoxin H7-like isoform X2 [Lycium barbarum]|uniref:thioredoxin H7-like isoform X2 n=1 Tax=Lycium barbarum TaxID=112863 RepID=UPI00293F216F|nr:thioredoxin H7-like isoform X2 [Lycium barbarum]
MGANYSTTWPEAHNMPITPPIKRSQVIAFHSSTKWKLHFGSLKNTNKLVVIDFTATWCSPCKYMEPVLNDFAAKYADVEFVKIDVDELADVAQEYEVQAMPSFVLIRKGKVVDKVVGADKDGLQKKIEKHRAHNMPTTPQIKGSQVMAFHSSTKWKLHFDALKDTNKLVVIDFTATWCGPCKYMEPVINDFAAKYTDVEFVKIDVDELADVAQEYEVQAMPTFVLIKKGKVVDKIVGADKDGLQKKIQKHRAIFI